MRVKILGALVLSAVLGTAGCGNDDGPVPPVPPQTDGGGNNNDGGSDAGDDDDDDGGDDDDDGGTDGGDDGGTDGGDDGGTDGGDDGGTDGGSTARIIEREFPQVPGWKLYGVKQGGPKEVYGVSADEGGNVWVAGGEEGLFLLRKGSEQFEKFTMADGLRPYGYMADGSDPVGEKYLKVLSVAGGPAGTVFVGYAGKAPPAGVRDCESNFHHGTAQDPNIYKSGDADKVTLTASGIKVVHYDISMGPNILKPEAYKKGREKICTIYRLIYDKTTNSVWFGGNHGFARGEADYQGDPTCNGQLHCSGVLEHTHPAILGPNGEEVTDLYYGLAADSIGDVWAGGHNRSTKFKYASYNFDYWLAQADSEGHNPAVGDSNKLDVWADPTDDGVSGMAVASGQVWVSSFYNGIAQLDRDTGVPVRKLNATNGLRFNQIGAMASDRNGNVWFGYRWVGGIARMNSGNITHLNQDGDALFGLEIRDLQVQSATSTQLLVVGFGATEVKPNAANPNREHTLTTGGVGIYELN